MVNAFHVLKTVQNVKVANVLFVLMATLLTAVDYVISNVSFRAQPVLLATRLSVKAVNKDPNLRAVRVLSMTPAIVTNHARHVEWVSITILKSLNREISVPPVPR